MTDTATLTRPAATTAEHFDVLIVGAGISGVGGAYHLFTQRPGTSYVVLEGLENFGGTWWMHRYPGIRSDSDLYTFGYRFKPWVGAPIASAEEILKYMGEVIEENDLGKHIRYGHRITRRPGRPPTGAGPSRRCGPTAARRCASPAISCGCARATTAIRKATPPSGRGWRPSRAGSSTRRPGRKTSTTRARRSSSSARGPRPRP